MTARRTTAMRKAVSNLARGLEEAAYNWRPARHLPNAAVAVALRQDFAVRVEFFPFPPKPPRTLPKRRRIRKKWARRTGGRKRWRPVRLLDPLLCSHAFEVKVIRIALDADALGDVR